MVNLCFWSTKNFLLKLKKRLASAEKAIVEAQKGRVTSDEREKLLTALETQKQENNRLQCRLQEFAENDPEVLEAMAREATQAVEAANRWTDNIYSIQSWIRKKFPSVEQVSNAMAGFVRFEVQFMFLFQSTFNKQFGVPEDLDYLE